MDFHITGSCFLQNIIKGRGGLLDLLLLLFYDTKPVTTSQFFFHDISQSRTNIVGQQKLFQHSIETTLPLREAVESCKRT